MIRWSKRILIVFLFIPLLFGLWLLLRAFVCDYFTIPTFSMYPTLKPGDEVIVNKLLMGARIYNDFHFDEKGVELKSWRTKGIRSIGHNDIVVFNYPYHNWQVNFVINHVFCKRVMALPGDTISIVDGFYRNNNYEEVLGLEDEQIKYADLPESECWKKYVQTYPYDKNIKWTAYHFGPMYIPRKGDVMNITPYEATLYKMILAWETGEPIECDWESNIVWAGDKHLTQHQWQHDYYFMAGDNVLDSDDSRFWGVVPEEYIVGIVDYKFSTK